MIYDYNSFISLFTIRSHERCQWGSYVQKKKKNDANEATIWIERRNHFQSSMQISSKVKICMQALEQSDSRQHRFRKKNFSHMYNYMAVHMREALLAEYVLSRINHGENVFDPPSLSLMIQDITLRRVRPVRPIKVYKIVHCDGLLLFFMDNQLLVWNPFLKETRWIKCGSDFHEFDNAYSLGYPSRRGDYRILRFRCASNSRNRPPSSGGPGFFFFFRVNN